MSDGGSERSTSRSRLTVALVGPDGAGKTTIARRLERELGAQAKYIYMGVNADASNHLLPTTRLVKALKRARGAPPDAAGPPDSRRPPPPPPRRLSRRALRSARSAGRVANQLAEEWYRQGIAWWYLARGATVIFDRHFFSDFYAYDIARGRQRPLTTRLHGLVLSRLYPKPDLVVYLDAPAEVLLARKGEGTLDALSHRRLEYLELAEHVDRFAVVDAGRPVEEVTEEVARLIQSMREEGTSSGAARPAL